MENLWISVKDKLPEVGKWVICWDADYEQVFICQWNGQRWDSNDMIYMNISHWMELPEKPE